MITLYSLHLQSFSIFFVFLYYLTMPSGLIVTYGIQFYSVMISCNNHLVVEMHHIKQWRATTVTASNRAAPHKPAMVAGEPGWVFVTSPEAAMLTPHQPMLTSHLPPSFLHNNTQQSLGLLVSFRFISTVYITCVFVCMRVGLCLLPIECPGHING